MATAALPITKSANDVATPTYEVRVWGMDTKGKPFIQTVNAGQFTEKTAGRVAGQRWRSDRHTPSR